MNAIRGVCRGLVAIELFIVAGAVGASVLSERFLLPAVVVIALFWPLRWCGTGRLSTRTAIDGVLPLFLLMLGVSLWATADLTVTLPEVYRVLTGIGLAYAVANWAETRQRLRLVVLGLLTAGSGLALATPFVLRAGTSSKLPFVPARIYAMMTPLLGDTIHGNVLGGQLVLLLPLAVAVLLFTTWRDRPFVYAFAGAAALVMAAGLVVSQSRGGLTGVAVAMALLISLRWRRGWVVLVGLGAGLVLLLWLTDTNVLIDSSTLAVGDTAYQLRTLDYRLDTWARAVLMIQDFPFTGVGMGMFEQVANLLYPSLRGITDVPHAHNLLLQVAVDLGLPGLIAWLAMLFGVVTAAWQVYVQGRHRQRRGSWAVVVGAGILASVAAMLVHGITDAVTWGMIRPAVLVWGVWGLALAAHRLYYITETGTVVETMLKEEAAVQAGEWDPRVDVPFTTSGVNHA